MTCLDVRTLLENSWGQMVFQMKTKWGKIPFSFQFPSEVTTKLKESAETSFIELFPIS